VQEDVAAVGLSSMSGAHARLFPAVIESLKNVNAGDIPVLGGGIIPAEDIPPLKEAGITSVFTPGTPVETIIKAFNDACSQHHQTRS
jgi:methylmalonyl-CoA mutase C-terminal domain/subunit